VGIARCLNPPLHKKSNLSRRPQIESPNLLTPAANVLVTGVYQGTAVFDVITLHSARGDIFLAELNFIPDHDKCEASRCGDQDDDNRANHGAEICIKQKQYDCETLSPNLKICSFVPVSGQSSRKWYP
jgi:hypothetical protein